MRQTSWVIAVLVSALLVSAGCGKKSENTGEKSQAGGENKAQSGGQAGETGGGGESGKGSKSGAGTKKGGAADEAVDPPNAVTDDAARIAPPIPTTELQALFDKWLAAQNDGDFAAYSALYAERFVGIKRSGARTKSFKKVDWLRDRKRMFGKAMKVEASRTELAATAETAIINFEQSWASGTYQDVGPKQLVVVRGDNGLRIAREEMLRSEVTSGEQKHKALSRDSFGFVVFVGGSAWVVLDTRPESKWAAGKPKLLSIEPYSVTVRDADVAKIPVQSRRMLNREMRLMGPNGQVCRGALDKIALLSRVRPHFGTIAYWKGEEGGKPLPDAQVAKEAWDLGDAGRLLVGRIAPVKENSCRGALWGRDAEQPDPVVLKPGNGTPILMKAALTAFRKLKGYGEIQKSYVEMTALPRPKHWDKFEKAAPTISVLVSADSKEKFIALAATAGSGCGDFYGDYWAIWRVHGEDDKPRLVLMTDDRAPGRYFVPRSAVDLDGDGKLEFIGTDAILQPVGPIVRETDGIEVPNLDCPC